MIIAEEFIKVWQTSQTKQDVIRQLGMNESTVNQRATRYRKMGIPLKDFRSLNISRDRLLDIEELSRLAVSYGGGDNGK